MMKAKMTVALPIMMLILIPLCGCLEDGEIFTKEGVLSNVAISGTTLTLTFNDGEVIQVKEDNIIDATEMHEYLSLWIDQSIIFRYYYEWDKQGNQIKSVSPSE